MITRIYQSLKSGKHRLYRCTQRCRTVKTGNTRAHIESVGNTKRCGFGRQLEMADGDGSLKK